MKILVSVILVTLCAALLAWGWLAQDVLALARAAVDGDDITPRSWRERLNLVYPPVLMTAAGLLVLWL
jgi:hypothetical protein